MTLTDSAAVPLTVPQQQVLDALGQRRYFKLICGGSFTDVDKIAGLVRLYTLAGGVDCLDIAPDPAVVQTVSDSLDRLPLDVRRPLVMVSLPLDPDPHFRKIDLVEPACITCNACLPVCPTEALAEGDPLNKILIDQPLCYGCGRCVEVCPTEALVLHPIYQDAAFQAVLAHPVVGAVEIHTHFADPYMLTDFLTHFATGLKGKLLSVCFRPDQLPPAQWLAFLEQLQAHTPWPVIVQADGAPMSGTEDPTASLPALAAARLIYDTLQEQAPTAPYPLTISGGINQHTASWLKDPAHSYLAGVGMGTVARRAVWSFLDDHTPTEEGLQAARQLVTPFKNRTVGYVGYSQGPEGARPMNGVVDPAVPL
jgi:ferredoxin